MWLLYDNGNANIEMHFLLHERPFIVHHHGDPVTRKMCFDSDSLRIIPLRASKHETARNLSQYLKSRIDRNLYVSHYPRSRNNAEKRYCHTQT